MSEYFMAEVQSTVDFFVGLKLLFGTQQLVFRDMSNCLKLVTAPGTAEQFPCLCASARSSGRRERERNYRLIVDRLIACDDCEVCATLHTNPTGVAQFVHSVLTNVYGFPCTRYLTLFSSESIMHRLANAREWRPPPSPSNPLTEASPSIAFITRFTSCGVVET